MCYRADTGCRTDGQMDGQTDGVKPTTSLCRVYNNILRHKKYVMNVVNLTNKIEKKNEKYFCISIYWFWQNSHRIIYSNHPIWNLWFIWWVSSKQAANHCLNWKITSKGHNLSNTFSCYAWTKLEWQDVMSNTSWNFFIKLPLNHKSHKSWIPQYPIHTISSVPRSALCATGAANVLEASWRHTTTSCTNTNLIATWPAWGAHTEWERKRGTFKMTRFGCQHKPIELMTHIYVSDMVNWYSIPDWAF